MVFVCQDNSQGIFGATGESTNLSRQDLLKYRKIRGS
jgi:hypothetical protein